MDKRYQEKNAWLWGVIETETMFHNNLMRYACNVIIKCQGNKMIRQLYQSGLFKVDMNVKKELVKLNLSADSKVNDKNMMTNEEREKVD